MKIENVDEGWEFEANNGNYYKIISNCQCGIVLPEENHYNYEAHVYHRGSDGERQAVIIMETLEWAKLACHTIADLFNSDQE